MSRRVRRSVGIVFAAFVVGVLTSAAPALAHSFASVVYVDLTSPERGLVRAELHVDSYLLVMATTDFTQDVELGHAGSDAQSDGDMVAQAAALDAHADSVLAYVNARFAITAEGRPCTPVRDGGITPEQRDDQPYVLMVLDYRCPDAAGAHEVRSELFPDSEGYVTDTKTIVTFGLDLNSGTAILDAEHRSFSTHQSWPEWLWSWFRVGAEHLLHGLDHILFVLALIVGSRRLREIVLAATTFTLAHSVTFILAALGIVEAPRGIVEPLIAASIAFVAGWHLWRAWRHGSRAADFEPAGDSHSVSTVPGGPGWVSCSASGSCTGSASPPPSASRRPGRGSCCRRSSSSTWASRPCSWRSSPPSSPSWLCCAAAHPARGSGRLPPSLPGWPPRA